MTPGPGAALALFAVDPSLGLALRDDGAEAVTAMLDRLRACLPASTPWRLCPASVAEDRLLGGLDLTATLAAGRRVAARGLLAEADGGVLVLRGADRLPPGAAAIVAAALDTGIVRTERDGIAATAGARFSLVLAGGPELPPGLLDRVALVTASGTGFEPPDDQAVRQARRRLASVGHREDDVETIVAAAVSLQIVSLRAPGFALRAARAAAALRGASVVEDEDLALAVALTLLPRAQALPGEDAPPPPPPDPADDPAPPSAGVEDGDRLVEAARALLPPGLLAQVAARADRSGKEEGGGTWRASLRRGRPCGTRPGLPRGGARLAVLETLRAAAPWQRLRGPAPHGRLAFRRSDFQIRRYREARRRTAIFVVDASGSSALHRLAEAKGAVELFLAECYVNRDRVALIAVRGRQAELLLPPTPALARAKRALAGLPGGGGTPLASGVALATELADQVRRAGQTAFPVFLTDGRPNVAKDGAAGRDRAEADTLAASRRLASLGIAALVIDTAPSPHPFSSTFAAALGARYVALPRAGAAAMARAVSAALPG